MDKSKFDDIIREKLESHVDPAGPSGAEMSRLFSDLPKAAPAVISTLTKTLVIISSLMVLITIFLIYRNYRLEGVVSTLETQIEGMNRGGAEVTYSPDTLFWDSLESITKRIVIQNQNSQQSVANSALVIPNNMLSTVPSEGQVKLSALDSQEFVNQVIEQLLATIDSNPELLKELLRNVPLSRDISADSTLLETPRRTDDITSPSEVRKSLVEELGKQAAIGKILRKIAYDSIGSAALVDIVSGNEPGGNTNDRLNLSQSTVDESFDPESLSEGKQAQVLEKYLAYDPSKVAQVSKELELDSAFVSRVEEYAEMEDLQKEVAFDSLVLERPALLSNEEIREEQEKQKNREWSIGGSVGYGTVELIDFESGAAISLQSQIERKLNERFSLSSGVEFYSAEVENYNVAEIDYSLFEGLPSDIATTAAEVKVNLTWLDIPLEAKAYLLPGKKVNPYIAVAIRARALVGEKYKIETSADDLLPTFQPKNKFVFPSYGVGIGADVELNTRVRTGLKINQLLGGKELGLFESEYRIFNGQAYLLFRLKK